MLFMFFCLTTLVINGAEFNGVVKKVVDGDTIIVEEDDKSVVHTKDNVSIIQRGTFTVRLADIDAPELTQKFGEDAKTHLQMLVDNRNVCVVYHQIDGYGRIIGTVYRTGFLNVKDNVSINEIMIENGYVWWFAEYSKKYQFSTLELEAKEFKNGIWSQKNNTPPWIFRKNKKNKKNN